MCIEITCRINTWRGVQGRSNKIRIPRREWSALNQNCVFLKKFTLRGCQPLNPREKVKRKHGPPYNLCTITLIILSESHIILKTIQNSFIDAVFYHNFSNSIMGLFESFVLCTRTRLIKICNRLHEHFNF